MPKLGLDRKVLSDITNGNQEAIKALEQVFGGVNVLLPDQITTAINQASQAMAAVNQALGMLANVAEILDQLAYVPPTAPAVHNNTYYPAVAAGTLGQQNADSVDITGGTINGTSVGATSPSTGAFTILSAGAGAVGAPSFYLATDTTTGLYRIGANNWGLAISGAKLIDFATALVAVTGSVSATSQLISSVATGTAPLVVASTTKVANLNADLLDGTDWAAPGTIGGTTPASATFTTLNATDNITITKAAGVPKVQITAGTGTAAAYTQITNTGGSYFFGVESSTGSSFGAPAYAGVVFVPAARDLVLQVGATVRGKASATGFDVTGDTAISGKFGCNTKAAQASVASGGALAGYVAGANGLDTGANMSALHAMVVSIRAALVANGIMS